MSKLSGNASSKVRPPAVAGRFYPGDPAELKRMIAGFLCEVKATDAPSPKVQVQLVIACPANPVEAAPSNATVSGAVPAAADEAMRAVGFSPVEKPTPTPTTSAPSVSMNGSSANGRTICATAKPRSPGATSPSSTPCTRERIISG